MVAKTSKYVLIPGLVFLAMFDVSCATQAKSPLGMTEGKLTPCPRRPNCVSSEEGAGSARIEPLAFTGTPGAARECLMRAIQDIGGTIEFESDGYIWAVFKTTVFGFIDDMEFRIDPRHRVVHLRSASRIGYYDFGVNHRRTAALRQRFLQEQARPADGNAVDP